MLTYTYRTQTQCALWLSPTATILMQEPPCAATFDKLTGILTCVPTDAPRRELKRRLLYCVSVVKKNPNWRFSAARQRCHKIMTNLSDRNQHLPLATNFRSPADFRSTGRQEKRNLRRICLFKQMQRAMGPYRVLEVRENNILIGQEGIPNTVSNGHVNPSFRRSDWASEGRE